MPNIAIQRRGGFPMWAVLVGVLFIALLLLWLFSSIGDRQVQPGQNGAAPATSQPPGNRNPPGGTQRR
jgi:hypothetical protein